MTCPLLLTDSADLLLPQPFDQTGWGIRGSRLEEGEERARSLGSGDPHLLP